MPATGPAAPQGLGQVTTSKRKQASVVEMLEYVKGLDIDPIKESDMLWIAEEAFNAALPPGWTEHQDEEGRIYFHSGATGESVWRHPMDDLFREIVEYQRSVVRNGGFHSIEDEIAELEENIRRDLADWMELFDEHGEKFFYNRRTDDSRFDDPRMAVYHNLYARIKMVAKMKERMPVLARAPRPDEPTMQEVELRRRQQDEEDRYLKCLIKVQSVARCILAKRVYRNKVAQATVQKGPQPLRGKLRLRMEKMGGKKELVLAMTTPHRRNRAAMKIQARMRGVLARKRFRPLVLHRAFLSKIVTKIQSRSRVWLAKRQAVRMRHARVEKAANDIQRVWRGHRDRMYVSTLSAQKARYYHYMDCVKFIQKRIRIFLQRKRLKEKYRMKFVATCVMIQRQVKVMRAKEQLHKIMMAEQPVQVVFDFTLDPKARGVMPFSLQMWTAPWVGDKSLCMKEGVGQFENAFYRVQSDFQKVKGPKEPCYYQHVAATRIQTLVRGMFGKKRLQLLKAIASKFIKDLTANFWKEVDRRVKAAIKVQSLRRMYLVRRKGLIAKMKLEHLGKCGDKIIFVQAQFLKYIEQNKLMIGIMADSETSAATHIQAVWRGYLARRHYEGLCEEALWTMKGWFEYTATGRDACQVEVKMVPNPSFDDYRHFVEYGPPTMQVLDYTIEDLESQLKTSIAHIEMLLGGPLNPPPGSSRTSKNPPEAAEASMNRSSSKMSAAGSARLEGKAPSERGDPRSISQPQTPSRGSKATDADAAAAASVDASPAAVQPTLSPPFKDTARSTARKGMGGTPLEAVQEEKPQPASPESPVKPQPAVSSSARAKAAPASARPKEAEPSARAESEVKATPKARAEPEVKATPKAAASKPGSKSAPEMSAPEVPGAPPSARPSVPSARPSAPSARPSALPSERGAKMEKAAPPADVAEAEVQEEEQFEPMLSQDSVGPGSAKKPKAKPFEPSLSHAHNFFSSASRGFSDKAPPPHPEDSSRPKAPAKHGDPMPPGPDPSTAKVQGIRTSQSEGALLSKAPVVRKSYGGTVVGGKFVRAAAGTIDEMSEADRQAVLADIEAKRQHQQTVVAEKSKMHKARNEKDQQAKSDKFKAQLNDAESLEEERRKKKVKEMKKWLKDKEEAARSKKDKDSAMIQSIVDKEREKAESLKRVEEDRQEQRERRLRIGERQKAKLEQQLSMSKEAARSAPLLMKSQNKVPLDAAGGKQRIVHRHIHHHLHYHDDEEGGPDGEGEGGPMQAGDYMMASDEQSRGMEMATEAKLGPGAYRDFGGLPQIDSGAETPTKRRALSHGMLPLSYEDAMRMSKTQQAFRQPQLPALPAYNRGLERAMGSYADSGRPARIKGFGH